MIDTSTTEGKIEVMQAAIDGKAIECITVDHDDFYDVSNNLAWDWLMFTYRIKPQTVKEAAIESSVDRICETYGETHNYIAGFKAGAEWQKEQE